MITFSIRLDEETNRKLEAALGDKTKADYVREVLIAHLNKPPENHNEPPGNLQEPPENLIREIADLKAALENKDNIIRIMGDRVKDLQQHNGFMVSEFTRINKMNEMLLLPGPVKPWWKFWK